MVVLRFQANIFVLLVMKAVVVVLLLAIKVPAYPAQIITTKAKHYVSNAIKDIT